MLNTFHKYTGEPILYFSSSKIFPELRVPYSSSKMRVQLAKQAKRK